MTDSPLTLLKLPHNDMEASMKDLDYDSVTVVTHILRQCLARGYDCGYTKAQKLLYIAYGTILGLYGIRLTQEHPKCWQLGPVFPRAYNAHHKGRIKSDSPDLSDAPEWVQFAVNGAVEHFGSWSAGELVEWTHKPGSPWAVSSIGGTNLYRDIDDSLIAADFKKIVTLGAGDPRPDGL